MKMTKWICIVTMFLSAQLFGLCGHLHGDCLSPCQPNNYNGVAFCLTPCEFYFPPCDCPWGADVNLRAAVNVGESIATDKDYLTLDLHLRQFYKFYELFIDGRWHYLTNWKNAASVGLGVRTFDCYCIVGGANIYYDYRRGPCHLDFHQISGGFELFHPCFSCYINGYYPFCTKKSCRTKVFCYDDGFFACCRKNVFAFGGFDIEVDKTLFYFCRSRINAGAGAYFYNNSAESQWFVGGRLRLSVDVNTNLYAEVEGTYDKFFKTKVQGKLSLNIPFPIYGGARKRSGCCETWCPPLPQRRQDLIVLKKKTRWFWNFDDDCDFFDGEDFDIYNLQ